MRNVALSQGEKFKLKCKVKKRFSGVFIWYSVIFWLGHAASSWTCRRIHVSMQ